MKKRAILSLGAAVALIGLVLAGCYSVPVTGRSSLNLVSDEAVIEMSKEQFELMKAQYPISHDPKYNQMVQSVGERIADVAGYDILNADWEFVVFDDPSALNAFAMAGGKVGVFTGIFKVAKTEDDLAIVMGHEIAHVAAKHINERLSSAVLAQGAGVGLGVAMGGSSSITQSAIMNAYGLGTGLGGLSFNRRMESEADHIGLMYAARAGYNPEAAIELWERMSSEGDAEAPPEFLSTHPSHDTRLLNLEKLMPEAIEAYEASKRGDTGESVIIIQ